MLFFDDIININNMVLKTQKQMKMYAKKYSYLLYSLCDTKQCKTFAYYLQLNKRIYSKNNGNDYLELTANFY